MTATRILAAFAGLSPASCFWNPKGGRSGVRVGDGGRFVRDVTVRPLLRHVPPGALRPPE